MIDFGTLAGLLKHDHQLAAGEQPSSAWIGRRGV
jgi:hypothetical protein